MAAAFEPQYAPEPGSPRNPATLAMPTSTPRARAAHRRHERRERVHHAEHVRFEDRAEHRQVLRRLGQRAARDARVRDDDIGQAVARDEVGGRAREIAPARARRRRTSRPSRGASARGEPIELRLAAREEPERRALRRVVLRQRLTEP